MIAATMARTLVHYFTALFVILDPVGTAALLAALAVQRVLDGVNVGVRFTS
jgi:small neutral amino acid transporter SnatA (MarC family)